MNPDDVLQLILERGASQINVKHDMINRADSIVYLVHGRFFGIIYFYGHISEINFVGNTK